MINKNILNDRQKEIDSLIDELIPNDNINELIKKYHVELESYNYINNVVDFSLLKLRGSMKYINRYDKKLRYGGLLIKIYEKNGKWHGIIKKINNKKYYISFDNNYIFYLESKEDTLRDWAELFITEFNNGEYEVE